MILFISTYNRFAYVKTSLDSLLESISRVCPEIIITDDGSTEPEVREYLEDFKNNYYGVCTLIFKKTNKGIPYGKLDTIKKYINDDPVEGYKEDYFLISDSDMLYKHGWIEELEKLYHETGAPLVTGFNCITNSHSIIKTFNTYHTKKSIGGCNVLVNTKFYLEHPFYEKNEWDFRMCERAHEQNKDSGLAVIASKPSLAQHIGATGVWARPNYYDKAEDF